VTDLPVTSGPWGPDQVLDHLHQAVIPIRLATVGRSGPMVQSLWFDVHDTHLWCATQADALVVRRLREDPRCGFEVAADAPPYRGVRGTAAVTIVPDAGGAVLRRLLERYLGGTTSDLARWLLSREATEVALRITPRTVTSWDFTARMQR
jgi:hypothetical protein